MCVEIYFPGEDDPVETVGELRERWPTIVFREGHEADDMTEFGCLCQIEPHSTAKANGASLELRADSMSFRVVG
jgi:hypothetical protein